MLPYQRAASPSIYNDASQLLHFTVVAELAPCVSVDMYLEVISNVVPKICARTNSAMMTVSMYTEYTVSGKRSLNLSLGEIFAMTLWSLKQDRSFISWGVEQVSAGFSEQGPRVEGLNSGRARL